MTATQTTTISSFVSPSFSIAIPEGAIIPPSVTWNRIEPYGKTSWTCNRSNESFYLGETASNTSNFNPSYPFGINRFIDGIELNSIAFRHARIAAFVDDCPVYINKIKQNVGLNIYIYRSRKMKETIKYNEQQTN